MQYDFHDISFGPGHFILFWRMNSLFVIAVMVRPFSVALREIISEKLFLATYPIIAEYLSVLIFFDSGSLDIPGSLEVPVMACSIRPLACHLFWT